MRDIEKKKVQNTSTNSQAKRAVKTARKDNKPLQEKGRKPSNAKETPSKRSQATPASNSVASDMNVSTESSEVYENVVIHYVDDAYRSGVSNQVPNGHENAIQEKEDGLVDDHYSEFGNDTQKVKGEESDFESAKDSSSSQGDSRTADDEKLESLPKKSPKKASSEKKKSDSKPKKEVKSHNPKLVAKNPSDNNNNCMDMKVHPSSTPSEGTEDEPIEGPSQEMFDAASNGAKSTESDTETVQTEENDAQQEKASLKEKVEMMESKIEKLEEELREVAALEISLYSVIPEHGSSAHKVHTPARRLSRLYIHACKHWKPRKRATIAQNTVSGLILVARTCGNDVARLTFWLSNTVVLRGIISQAFGISSQLKNGAFSKLKGVKQVNKTPQLFEDWQEKSTFTAALEKIESWIFSRVVESVWWQALTPNMLSPVEDLINQKSIGRLLGPALGDQKQGNFSIELWINAFQTAFERLCPVRAAGHECGCLPALARMVMEQCVSRLDVAMFNAILRESAHQIPTDPVSDPIVDSRVLPIPAGELSFGSGAQLKNAVGNWSTWFADSLGLENGHPSKDHHFVIEVDDNKTTHAKTDCFQLLNELSDLLMLPKDMLMDRSIRKEVCPSIILPVMIRILCNFTPDEFCPDAVPGEVLEALNAENFVERRVAGESSGSFPYGAAVVAYSSPSIEDILEKVAEAGGKSQLERNASMVQKKGYTSDEELDDHDSPFSSLIEPSSPSTSVNGKGSLVFKGQTGCGGNARYELLREVWSS